MRASPRLIARDALSKLGAMQASAGNHAVVFLIRRAVHVTTCLNFFRSLFVTDVSLYDLCHTGR